MAPSLKTAAPSPYGSVLPTSYPSISRCGDGVCVAEELDGLGGALCMADCRHNLSLASTAPAQPLAAASTAAPTVIALGATTVSSPPVAEVGTRAPTAHAPSTPACAQSSSGLVCSNRGQCDTLSGQCACHSAFMDAACECPLGTNGKRCFGRGVCNSTTGFLHFGTLTVGSRLV